MKVFIQSIVAQILLNPYIFWRGYQAIPPKKSWRIPYILFFILELSIFFFGFTFRNVLPDSVMIAIQYICNTWYIASIYITLSLLSLEVLRLSNRFFHWFPGWITSHWKQTKLVLFFLYLYLFAGAKLAHLALLPIPALERRRRARSLVGALDELFGPCSLYGECAQACPAGIPLTAIAVVNRERLGVLG